MSVSLNSKVHLNKIKNYDWAPNLSGEWVISVSNKTGTGVLCLAVTFKQWAAHAYLKEVLDVRQQWSTSTDHESAISTKGLFGFLKKYWVINFVSELAWGGNVLELGLDSIVQGGLCVSLNFFELCGQKIIKSGEKPWHAHENCGLN